MNLKELGLTEYEAKAYEALIKLGKSSASEISRQSGVSYGKIYEVLASLEAMGLVKVIPEKTKKFIVSDPENINKLIEQKEKTLQKLRQDVKELKQIYETREEEVVEIAKGKRNFYRILKELPEEKTFAYQIKYTAEYSPEIIKKIREILKKKIKIKTLTRYDEETKDNIKKWLKLYKNIKKFDNKGVAIDLRDNSVMIALIKSNIIMSIKDKAFISLMKNLFEIAYSQAEEIKE